MKAIRTVHFTSTKEHYFNTVKHLFLHGMKPNEENIFATMEHIFYKDGLNGLKKMFKNVHLAFVESEVETAHTRAIVYCAALNSFLDYKFPSN